MKAAHPMPFPATRQPSATEPPYLRTIRPSAASRPERDTGRKRSRIMLSRQQRDATHGRTACIAANPAVPQTQPQTCGHVSAVPTCHPVRPATGYGTDKDSIGGGLGPPQKEVSSGAPPPPPTHPPPCGNDAPAPPSHPVRPAPGTAPYKHSRGGAFAPPILSFRCGTTTRPTSLPPTCRPAGLRRNNRPLNLWHPKGASHPLSPPCLHSTVRDGSQEHRYRKYRTPIPERCRA